MALTIGKITLLIGAGIVGSVLAKDGRLSASSDLFSGTLKRVLKRLTADDSSAPNSKPKNDVWLRQVNDLREELHFYASNRSVTIVTSTSSGGRVYYVIVVIMVVGGYLWWRGVKLPDLMLATKRSLSNACTDIEGKLQNVHSSIVTTKQQVSSELNNLDNKLEETKKYSEAAKIEVSNLRGDVKSAEARVKSVLQAVGYLETGVDRFEGKQGILFSGMRTLLNFVRGLEKRRAIDQTEVVRSSSSQYIAGLPTPSRVGSVASNLSLEPVPPSASTSNGPLQQQKRGAIVDKGLKLDVATNGEEAKRGSMPQPSCQIDASGETGNGSSGFGLFGGKCSGSVVTRSRSAKLTFKI